jgi:hypothetical protein
LRALSVDVADANLISVFHFASHLVSSRARPSPLASNWLHTSRKKELFSDHFALMIPLPDERTTQKTRKKRWWSVFLKKDSDDGLLVVLDMWWSEICGKWVMLAEKRKVDLAKAWVT